MSVVIVRPNLVPGYTIVERLATGGLSGVFRALRDADGLEVALKVTSLADLDPEFRPQERFEREADLLARLSHAALPKLHDWGVTLEGYGWLALELVRGVPLSHFSLRPAWELVPILIPVAEALAAVARAGIVHRDVAPDNVLVAVEDGRFAPKLIDFGVAKDLFASDSAGLTQHGAFLGKLVYAPPEQLLGLPKGQTLDFRADVYSFGLTVWELFTGRPAVQAPTLPEIVNAHLAHAWPKLSLPPARGGPAPGFVDLVERMTARRREDRPSSWEEVVAGLWQAMDEVRPVARELEEKRAELSPFGDVPPPEAIHDTNGDDAPFPRAETTRAEAPQAAMTPSLEPTARLLSREILFGRIVLLFGIAAFAGALAFAVNVIVSAPEPPAGGIGTKGTSAAPLSASGSGRRSLSGRPGLLLVALVPDGVLEEVTSISGRRVAGPLPLPAQFPLPPGPYKAILSSAASGCAVTVAFEVRPGQTTRVLETCLDTE